MKAKRGSRLFVRVDLRSGSDKMTEQDFNDHLAYVESVAAQRYLLGGHFTNKDGGMLLFEAKTRKEAEEIAHNDPLIQKGFYSCNLYAWKLVVTPEDEA
jgi:YCII-related domain.